MKKILTPFLLLFTIVAIGQPPSGGPDNFGYTYKNSFDPTGPTYQWFDISVIGSPVSGLSDDNFVGPFSIAGFPYYNSTPSQFWIGSNGYIAFNATNIASTAATFPVIPTTGGPNDFIAPLLTDLSYGGASSNPGLCYFYDQGDTVCVTFEQVPFWINNGNQYGGENTFQIILNRADSSITFNYQKQVGLPDPVYTNNFISIGIENGTGNDGLQYLRGDTFPNLNTSVKFYYPTIVQPVTDAEVDWVDNEESGAIFLNVNEVFNPTATIKNTGNQDITTPISLSYLIESSTNSIVAFGTYTLDSLLTGDDSLVLFPNSFTPSIADRYSFTTYINRISGDNIQSNDTNKMFFKVVDTTTTTQILDYSNGINNAGAIGWTGGNGGTGVYIEPPYYPARIVGANYYITTTGAIAPGYSSVIFDDNGRLGAPGTVLDSAFMPVANITTNTYQQVPLNSTSPIIIASGGIYLHWLMGGDGINLGLSLETPASQRTFEVLFGSWAPYRDRATQDFLMQLEIAPVTVGLEKTENNEQFLNIYPNPAQHQVTIELKKPSNNEVVELMDVSGKKVEAKVLNLGTQLRVYKGNLNSGIYYIRVGKQTQKIVFID